MANDDPIDALIGVPKPGEPYPWLNERRMQRRKARERQLFELPAPPTDPNSAILKPWLESVFAKARRYHGLRADEERCIRLSTAFSVEEIAVLTDLGPKTVRRRIQTARQKLLAAARAMSDSDDGDGV